MEDLRIGEVVRRTGLSAKTIRYYEQIGLIPGPKRTESWGASDGYRLFQEQDVRRLEFIREARKLDLSLKEIQQLFSDAQDQSPQKARRTLALLLRDKQDECRKRISELTAIHNQLGSLAKSLMEQPVAEQRVASCGCGQSPCG